MAFQTVNGQSIWQYTPNPQTPGKVIIINLASVQYIEASPDYTAVWIYFAQTGVSTTQTPYPLVGTVATQFMDDLTSILTNEGGGATPTTYVLSDADDGSAPAYYGYLAASGAWYIKKYDGAGMRYAVGETAYTDNWIQRTSLQYQLYNDVF